MNVPVVDEIGKIKEKQGVNRYDPSVKDTCLILLKNTIKVH